VQKSPRNRERGSFKGVNVPTSNDTLSYENCGGEKTGGEIRKKEARAPRAVNEGVPKRGTNKTKRSGDKERESHP